MFDPTYRPGDNLYTNSVISYDPDTGAGALSTAGSLVFVALLDGTVAAFDDTTLEEVWKMVASAEKRGGKVVAAHIGGTCVPVMNGVFSF